MNKECQTCDGGGEVQEECSCCGGSGVEYDECYDCGGTGEVEEKPGIEATGNEGSS